MSLLEARSAGYSSRFYQHTWGAVSNATYDYQAFVSVLGFCSMVQDATRREDGHGCTQHCSVRKAACRSKSLPFAAIR